MTRISRASSHRGVSAVSVDRPGATARKKKPYKIVLEAVTEKKRKLQSITTYHDQAPHGFGYIPLGFPEITEWCKEQCRQRNLDVHIVSAKPHSRAHVNPEKISHHVHRIGHHFPLEIIELACKKFGYVFDEATGLSKLRANHSFGGTAYFERGIADYQQKQRLHGHPMADTETKADIRGAVRELFPKIPEADLDSIVNHAFEEGTDRVGNATELPLARRVQLAVVAHIRHTYTDYDKILKQGSWSDARREVEHLSLAKLKEWRDEGEISNELEETFREVIVLDDEEDLSEDESPSASNTHESSMEFVSSKATARDLQPEPFERNSRLSFARRLPNRTIVVPSFRFSASRGYLTSPTYSPVPIPGARPAQPVALESLRAQPPVFQSTHSRPRFTSVSQASSDILSSYIVREPRDAVYVETRLRGVREMRDAEGRLYHLTPIDQYRPVGQVSSASIPSRNPPVRYANSAVEVGSQNSTIRPISGEYRPVHSRGSHAFEPILSHSSRPRLTPSSRRASDQDVVLPSIEREPEIQTAKRKSFPAPMNEDHYEQGAKRTRAAHGEQPPYEAIDLTSPRRPVYDDGQGAYEAARPRLVSQPINREYVVVPSRRLPVHDASSGYREVHVREPSRVYDPAHEGLYDRRGVQPGYGARSVCNPTMDAQRGYRAMH